MALRFVPRFDSQQMVIRADGDIVFEADFESLLMFSEGIAESGC